ncbi:ribbon-helix-helix protein, CopG family [Schaalia sp. 19OD2882]|uniref:ribbon-helix-helix protein, CopG family n=1 Tax=Schaalia sp. 19OD2882 TaxID=2794089 RepID=UPI001C1F1527|nr:ribbon-helix-helix protein, CopG family [Schaalia sp. 19OD2882]QWW20160.1 ribbon-helix-helix protein, CopG family [Schaalia sp. 19OD2882]
MVETIKGVSATEEQIASWAEEAEVGCDAEVLRRRGRGRPRRGTAPSRVVTVRFTEQELAFIDAKAARLNKTRSELLREAVFV